MFKAEKALTDFEEMGYVVLSSLEEETIDRIFMLYEETKEQVELDVNFYTTIWSNNEAYKDRVNKELKGLLSPFLDNHLEDYEVAFANFMVKKSGYASSLQAHQDWTFVKEPEFYSITVWVPLMEVTKENGALEVLPRSNKLKNYVRARFMNSPFSDHNDYIAENLMKSIPLKKGEALLVNSRTIHASPDNMSGMDRVAASIVVYPKKASLLHYVMDENQDTLLEELAIDTNFFVKYNCFEKPQNEKVTDTKYHEGQEVSIEQLNNL